MPHIASPQIELATDTTKNVGKSLPKHKESDYLSPITPIILPDLAPSLRKEWRYSGLQIVQEVETSIFPGGIPAETSMARFTDGKSRRGRPRSARTTNEGLNCSATSSPTS